MYAKLGRYPARSAAWHLLNSEQERCQCQPRTWDEEGWTCDACLEKDEEGEDE